MNTETRNLKLKTSWISTSTTAVDYDTIIMNSTGAIENQNETYTWYNINLRQVMGDAYYNKYSKFSITSVLTQPTFLETSYSRTELESNSDVYNNTMIEYRMYGLNFDPSVNSVLIQTAVDPMFPQDSTGTGFKTTPAVERVLNPTYCFSKPELSDTVNIKIDRIVLNTQANRMISGSNSIIGHSMFLFEITGINN